MNKKLFFIIFILGISFSVVAQQLPIGTCGIVNIYDQAGNRTKRIYFCNNGTDPYPLRVKQADVVASETNEYQFVDALYPNPTTGKFFVEFSKALNHAQVYVTDINGKKISQFKGEGYRISFDLSSVSAGVYFIKIEDGKTTIIKKVVKL